MRVTENMRTEGMIPLLKLAGWLDEEGTGLQITRMGEITEIHVDSLSFSGKKARFLPSDLRDIAAELLRLADEADELFTEEGKAGPEDHPWLRIDPGT